MSLADAVDIVAFKDAQPFRQAVFSYLSEHKPAVRFARGLHRRLGRSRLSSVLVGTLGLKAYLSADLPEGQRIVAVGQYRNEGRQFDYIEALLGEPLGRAELGRAVAPGALAGLVALGRQRRQTLAALRLIHDHNRRSGDFLVACRVAETVGYHLRFTQLWRDHDALAVLVSSDSNPVAMAVTDAARAAGRRTIYITHGHIPDGPPRLDFDLSIVDGPAVLRVYDESQGRQGAVVFKGAEGAYRPLDTAGLRAERPLTVGVFMSLIVDWAAFAPVLQQLRDALKPERLILRLHPNQTIRDPQALEHLDLDASIEVSLGETLLTAEAARCDLVIAGNSSAHLTLLRFGVPTASVPGLDLVPHDFYRFLRCRIVPHFPTVQDLDRQAVADFFEDSDWAVRFSDFDAGYQREGLEQDVRDAVLTLLGDP